MLLKQLLRTKRQLLRTQRGC